MTRITIAALSVAAIAGCDGRRDGLEPTDAAAAETLHFDAAMLGVPDGGVARTDAFVPDTDAGSDPALDMRLFVPDIPFTYTGMLSDPGIELVAWTIREDPVTHDVDFLLAVRNTYGSPLCALEVDVTFYDASETQIGDASALIEGPPHRGVSGTGHLSSGCISDGQIGMYSASVYLVSGRTADEITSATYVTSAINLVDAVPTSDLTVSGVTTVPGPFHGHHFVGQVENHAPTVVHGPSVWVFALNAVGRPLVGDYDVDTAYVSSGSSWAFDTFPDFDETYATFVAFPDASDY